MEKLVQQKLIELYSLAKQLRQKRQAIQRRVVFSEPVMGLSLDQLASNNRLERTEVFTDNTSCIEEIDLIDEWVVERLYTAGYYRMSDLAIVDRDRIQSETNLPWNAVNELYQMATAEHTIPFEQADTVQETCTRSEAIKNLIESGWMKIVLLEYSILRWLRSQTKCIYTQDNIDTKLSLIKTFVSCMDKPKTQVEAISYCTNSAEQYVKDVISGRAEKGLSNTERDEILERDEYQCRACMSEEDLEVHHIIPVSEGGGKEDSNLCTLCADCHFTIAHGGRTAEITYNTQKEFWSQVIGEKTKPSSSQD